VIDAVRAARNITETGAGNRWLAIGGSQGGHAAIATNELAESWAPELDLVGTVALAPGAMFDRTYGGLDDIIARVIGVMMLYGAATEHPELIPTDYVSPQVAAAADSVLPTGCLNDIAAALAVIPAENYWTNDPRVTEPARTIMFANDVGNVASTSPLLVVQGTADTTVLVDRTRDLFDRLCTTGQTTEYTEYDGATHDDIGARASDQIRAWVAARFADAPVVDSCPPAEPPAGPSAQPTAQPVAHPVAHPVSVRPQFTG
jgi:alpha-beta hydrolase superfamily lysophospholipase